MIRSKGEAGTGDIVEAVRHIRLITGEIRRLGMLEQAELATAAKELAAPLELVRQVAADGSLPVVLFCAGGIATPADAALMMALGAEGVFVGSGIFKSEDPPARAQAIVEATTRWQDPERVARRASAGSARRWSASRARSWTTSNCWPSAAGSRPVGEQMADTPLIGVLSLQGGFAAHGQMLRGLGAQVREVRVPGDLDGLEGLVIPGGESTTMTLGIEREGLAAPLRRLAAAGTPILGSCAGLIMLDREHLGLMDIRAERNAFGRQLQSFEADLEDAWHRRRRPPTLRPVRPLKGVFYPRAVDRRVRTGRGDPRRSSMVILVAARVRRTCSLSPSTPS